MSNDVTKSSQSKVRTLLTLGGFAAAATLFGGLATWTNPDTVNYPDRWNIVWAGLVISIALLSVGYFLYRKKKNPLM